MTRPLSRTKLPAPLAAGEHETRVSAQRVSEGEHSARGHVPRSFAVLEPADGARGEPRSPVELALGQVEGHAQTRRPAHDLSPELHGVDAHPASVPTSEPAAKVSGGSASEYSELCHDGGPW